ncbi:hypothetical protein P691DRAFT_736646 [Macrolepiota fuliginosa MF-IS2]|uniref:Uncharacterized protein n=1 Tax=Macrolepiota fuliginosa MF-IS2 TaxID=1400762 RepID=A0A9P6C084_9AGAR|nr:hypothetical protein P691DRAFT_736646 [Macrolepiota fuliginosa MF-IS2]
MDQNSSPLAKYQRESVSVLLNIWIYFNLVSNNILLPILLFTILVSNRLQRHATFINVCSTWVLSGIFSLLLFYAHQYRDSEPHKALCIAQASLLFGIPPMWGAAAFVFFYYVYKSLEGKTQQSEFGTLVSWLMFGAPYLFQISFSAVALVISLKRPDLVNRQFSYFYCDLHFRPLALARTTFVMFCIACTSLVQLLLIYKTYRNYSAIRRLSTPEAKAQLHSILRCVVRVSTLAIYVAFGSVLELVSIIRPESILPQMYMATVGTVVFLVFGTQWDVLCVWFPCLFKQESQQVTGDSLPRTLKLNRDSIIRS